tara:strand:- start:52918 stop:53562 length:645 start_codon:yes stop_codon:yes gene_type:complete
MLGETHCPLCDSTDSAAYARDRRREYLQCQRCDLVYVPPAYYLAREAELAEYQLHENTVHDAGYRRFLSRLAQPLVERLPAGARGLDFGCGPGPALAQMLREQGFEVALYDPFFAPDERPFEQVFDFICATEVVEHLHRPGWELQRLWSLLAQGGWLGVMTKLVLGQEAFARWHYKNDPTHVCFFSRTTWQWWAQANNAELVFVGSDVMLLGKG